MYLKDAFFCIVSPAIEGYDLFNPLKACGFCRNIRELIVFVFRGSGRRAQIYGDHDQHSVRVAPHD